MEKVARGLAVLVLLAAVVAIGAVGWRYYSQRYTVTVEDDGRAVARVVTARLDGASALKVATLSGIVQSKAVDTRLGGLLNSDHVIKAPFTVDYFIDVSRLTPADMRWDQAHHTLLVNVPEVDVGKANVDEGRATLVETRGLFVTRSAADAMTRQTSALAQTTAQTDAAQPKRIVQARDHARRALGGFLAAPLRAAGIRVDTVTVVFPSERKDRAEQWDTSRSLAEVFANSQ